MEAEFEIIPVIVFGIFILASVAGSAKKRARQTAQDAPDTEEDWLKKLQRDLQEEDTGEGSFAGRKQTGAFADGDRKDTFAGGGQHSTFAGGGQDGSFADATTASQSKRKKQRKASSKATQEMPAKMATAPSKAMVSDALSGQKLTTEPATEKSQIAEEFDVRKAVIYAEILEPKFKEYE